MDPLNDKTNVGENIEKMEKKDAGDNNNNKEFSSSVDDNSQNHVQQQQDQQHESKKGMSSVKKAKTNNRMRSPQEVLASLNHSQILESPRVPSWLLKDAETHKKSMSIFTASSKRNCVKSLRRKGIASHHNEFVKLHKNEEESSKFWNATWPELENKGWKRNKNGYFMPPNKKIDQHDNIKTNIETSTMSSLSSSNRNNTSNKNDVNKISVMAKRSKNKFFNIRHQGMATKSNRVIHSVDWIVAIPLKNKSILKDHDDKESGYKLKCQVYLYNELDGILMIRLPSGRTSHLSIGLDDFSLVSSKFGRNKDAIYRRLRKRLIGYEKLQHRCAAKIQSLFRFFNIRSQTEPKLKALRLARKRLRSTIKIQSAYKGYLTRKSFKNEIERLRKERDLRRQKRAEEQKKRAARRKRYYAATKIQANVRGRQGRKAFIPFKNEKINAANVISHNYRGYVYRKHIQAGGIEALLKHVKQQKKSAKKAKRKHRKTLEAMKEKAGKVEKKLEFGKGESDKKIQKPGDGKKSKDDNNNNTQEDVDDKRFDEEEVLFVPPSAKEETKDDLDKKSTTPELKDDKRIKFVDESDDEEDKEWLALQEKRKKEVLKETTRENATHIPVHEIDKIDRLAVVRKKEVLQQMSLKTTLLAYEAVCHLSILVPVDLFKMIPKKAQIKPSARKCLQALTNGFGGMKQVTLSTRIYVGRNMARFVLLVPAKKKERRVINILLSSSEDPGEDEVRYVYIVDGNDFMAADDKELSRQYITLQNDILDRKKKDDKWVRWAKYLAAVCSRYGLSNAENQKSLNSSPIKAKKEQQEQHKIDDYSRRITLRSPVTAEMKVKKRRGIMGLDRPPVWYPDEYTLHGRTLSIDYTVTKHTTLLEKLNEWPTANITVFLKLLHQLREKLQHSDEHLLKAVEKKIFQDSIMKTPEEEALRNHEIIHEWLDDLIGEVIQTIIGDDEEKNDSSSNVSRKKIPLRTLSQKEIIEKKFKEFGADTRKKLEHLFQLFDRAGTGMVNVDEFKAVLKLFMEEIDEKYANYFIAYFDENGDGKIEFEEFADIVLEANPQDSLTLNYQPLILSYALKYEQNCVSNIEVLHFGPCPPLKCAWHPPQNCRVFEDIVVMNPPTKSAKKHLKLRTNLSKKKREFLMNSCMSIEWMVSVYTYADDGKKEWKLARATGYEGYTRTLFVEQLGHFDMGVIRDLNYKRKALAGENVEGCVCREHLLIREQLESGRIRLVRPLNRASVKLFEQLYKLYVTDEMIDAYSRKAKPPALDGEMQSGDDEEEYKMEDDVNPEEDVEDEMIDDGLGFPIIKQLEIRWKALKHGAPGQVSKHILLTEYEVRKMHKNELGYFVSGYDINAGSNPPTLHFHLGDASDEKLHAGLEITERRQDDPGPLEIYEEAMKMFKYVYESSDDDFQSTDSETYKITDDEELDESDSYESTDEEESKESMAKDDDEIKEEETSINKDLDKEGGKDGKNNSGTGEEKETNEEGEDLINETAPKNNNGLPPLNIVKKEKTLLPLEKDKDATVESSNEELLTRNEPDNNEGKEPTDEKEGLVSENAPQNNNGLPPINIDKKKKTLLPLKNDKDATVESSKEIKQDDEGEKDINKDNYKQSIGVEDRNNKTIDDIADNLQDNNDTDDNNDARNLDTSEIEDEDSDEETEEDDEDAGHDDYIKIKWRIKLLNYKKRDPFEVIASELYEEKGEDVIAVEIDGEVEDIVLDGDDVELLEDLVNDDSKGSQEFKELKAFFEKESLETIKEVEDVGEDNIGAVIDTIKEEDIEDLDAETV